MPARHLRGAVGAVTAVLMLTACSASALASGSKPAAQGISAKTISIGTVLPLTGGAAIAAQGVESGMEAAIRQANADGGINGRRVKLTVLDDDFDAATHVADFKRLVYQDKVFAVLTPAGTANIPGDWPTAESTGVPVFAPYLPADPGLPSVFSLGTSHFDQTEILAKYLAGRGIKTIAFIGQQNSLGTSMFAGLKAAAATYHLTITSTQYVDPNSTDVSAAVLNVKATRPQAVVLATDNAQSTLVLKQAQQLAWHPVFGGDSSTAGTYSGATTAAAGTAANGLLGTYFAASPSDTANPAVAAWERAESKYAPGTLTAAGSSFALQAYAFAEVFLHILKQMGARQSGITWARFRQVAQSLHDYSVGGLIPPVTFGPLPHGHLGTSTAKIARYENGAWITLTPSYVTP